MANIRKECISTRAFYGEPSLRVALRVAQLEQNLNSDSKSNLTKPISLPCELAAALTGPSRTWRLFKKQDAALNFARVRRNELMTFVYQCNTGVRRFIVAHPKVYWFYDLQRKETDRCSFEIIPEHSVCKLYFDLEFEVSLNLNKNGNEMTETFICIVNFFIKQKWGININRSCILDLDSTSEVKFSRHLIYQLPNAAFRDNSNVGNFVKMLCGHLRTYICETYSFSNINEAVSKPLKERSGDVTLNLCLDSISKSLLLDLLVVDRKGNKTLFCDEAVYTKNRHFRLYGSTKRDKNAPLKLSSQNHYKPKPTRPSLCSYEDGLFLDSLITYFPSNICDLKLLEYNNKCNKETGCLGGRAIRMTRSVLQDGCNLQTENVIISPSNYSPHPEIDNFIMSIIKPGHVWRWFYFSSNFLVYDIIGYRYCGNIKRHHHSNGIKYIVNLNTCTYYQKCYDPDCVEYRSPEKKLPAEIVFLYEDDDELNPDVSGTGLTFEPLLDVLGLEDIEMAQVLDSVENAHEILEMSNN